MSGGSDGGGENLPKIAMWCFIYTTVVTLLATVCFSFVAAPMEDIDVSGAATSIQNFSGDSYVDYIGWTLDGCYTPGYYNQTDIALNNNVWTTGDDVSASWFIPGELLASKYIYPNGITTAEKLSVGDNTDKNPFDPVRLSYEQKSSIHLKAQYETLRYSFKDLTVNDWLSNPINSAVKTITGDEGIQNLYYWYFNGWRYQFSPVSAIQADNAITEEVKLNIVWFANPDQRYDESIEGGFLIYAEDQDNFVWYTDAISLSEIIKSYKLGVSSASKYAFDFQGNTVYMFLKFDQGIETTMSLEEAFSRGYWSVQFASPVVSMSSISTEGITNIELSAGRLLQTFSSIVTPWDSNLIPSPWSYFLAIFITAPAVLVIALISVRTISAFLP